MNDTHVAGCEGLYGMDDAFQNLPLGSNFRVGPMGFLLKIYNINVVEPIGPPGLHPIEGFATASDEGAGL